MSLPIGTKIGPYEVTAPLGTGGMGEVFRARDTRLNRDAAIKVLPAALAQDGERVARFRREAQMLAALNHPNIAAIHGLEEADGTVALALEYVDGEDLAARLTRGPVPLDEALAIARQIADGLEAAHDKGIVHRDLKPANIKVGKDGTVKILDFGLAKALDAEGSAAGALSVTIANSPTMMSPVGMTVQGMILGTAAYMAPEQARGGLVDRRADLWAFGLIVFEMLTGKSPFASDTVSDTLAAVLTREIDWTQLPAATPSPIRRLLRRCVEKDRKRRLGDATSARLEIEEAIAGAVDDSYTPRASADERRSWSWALSRVALPTAVMSALVAGGAAWLAPPPPAPASRLTLTIVPPDGVRLRPAGTMGSVPHLSPDGSAVMFQSAPDRADVPAVFVRRLDSLEAAKVSGSYSVGNEPFWHGSSRVTFPARDGAAQQLLDVRLSDGAATKIAQFSANTRGGSWSGSGTFFVGGLVPLAGTAGATPTVVKSADGSTGVLYYPEFLGSTHDVLALFATGDDIAEVVLATVRDGLITNKSVLFRHDTAARYTPWAGGRVLFVKDDNLYSQRVNLAGRALEGEPELIVRGVASQPGLRRADFSVSDNGTIAWRPGRAALAQVTVLNRQGTQDATAGPPGAFSDVLASPADPSRLLLGAHPPWLVTIGDSSRTMLRDAGLEFWAADGRLVGMRPGSLIARDVTGGSIATVGALADSVDRVWAISPDGQFVIGLIDGLLAWARLTEVADARRWTLFAETDERQVDASFSPDGRFVLYESEGRIYVQPFPSPSRRQLIAESGNDPVWRGDGREILYLSAGSVWSVAVTGSAPPAFAAPVRLFDGVRRPPTAVAQSRTLAVSRDGSRIILAQGVEQADSQVIHVMIEALSQK